MAYYRPVIYNVAQGPCSMESLEEWKENKQILNIKIRTSDNTKYWEIWTTLRNFNTIPAIHSFIR